MNEALILGIDIGGSHISTALVDVDVSGGTMRKESFCKNTVDAKGTPGTIFEQWATACRFSLSKASSFRIKGIAVSMPGPFNYEEGISLIKGVNKYEHLYGLDIRKHLKEKLGCEEYLPVLFENDAICFGLGESMTGETARGQKVIAITLGTGLGAAFLDNGNIQRSGYGVPPEGYLYNVPFKESIAEDYISTKWLVNRYNQSGSNKVHEAKEMYELAVQQQDTAAIEIFREFGKNLGVFLAPWIRQFKAERLIIGGNLAKASSLFLKEIKRVLEEENLFITVRISNETELSAIKGAAAIMNQKEYIETINKNPAWRKTSQPLLPVAARGIRNPEDKYNIYPFTALGAGKIFRGFSSLTQWMSTHRLVLIDGYSGVDWNDFEKQCSQYFQQQNIKVKWWRTSAFQKPFEQVEQMVKPFLGEPGSVWGRKTTLALQDFYRYEELENLQPDAAYDVNIVIGFGAAFTNWDAALIYVDLPKNEIQYRARAHSANNLGSTDFASGAEMYKRFYFVDWVVLNKHRDKIKNSIDVIADGQWKDDLAWSYHSSIKEGLKHISQNIIRVRPWFEAGAWGGQWMKKKIPGLNRQEVNYAWSFELIVPENGLVFESDENLLEISFDWLMEYDSRAVLGKDAAKFGTEFPIRFDFLDTFDGGNLSVQCHPALDYIQKEFGENITQDETYYILDCQDDAQVYLGFREGIDPSAFRNSLESSHAGNVEIEIEKYVQKFPSHKHDLFLIPNGTIHSSGKNNLVLEISATPYIFTFKMYDWLRLDLNGQPRPINIERAFNNLDFSRKGKKVVEELISKPVTLEKKEGFQLIHLPTHSQHFYDVHRIEFLDRVCIDTCDQCHILMVVEGKSVLVRTGNGDEKIFNYAETFVIPAAAASYTLINQTGKILKVIKAFLK